MNIKNKQFIDIRTRLKFIGEGIYTVVFAKVTLTPLHKTYED